MLEAGAGGAPKDAAEAGRWYRKAAEAGDAAGMAALGGAYENGAGDVAKDMAEAARWYQKAAELGNETAKAALVRLSPPGAKSP